MISWISLAEVYYRVIRDHGRDEADLVLSVLRQRLNLHEATPDRILAAARIKAAHSIAFADCFAVATAAAHGVTLVTGDPEILERADLGVPLEDLRP